VQNLQQLQNTASDLVQVLRRQPTLLDLEDPEVVEAVGIKPCHADFLREARIHRAVPMVVGDGLLGFICLGDRVKWQPFSFEELELLRTIAGQVAASLLNLRLSERLRQAKEMEAFQTVSTFFVHDLKNLAAKLSMTLKNLPVHFDNPEFREDALRLMSSSVDQINSICSRLSLLRQKLEIRPIEVDLNQVVTATLAGLNGALAGCVVENLQPVPKVSADAEQIQKVLTNLILNARDAIRGKGEIRVTTGTRDEWAELTVKDDGCGMTKEFLDHSLFRPFRTTKPKGTGIGLFQSKMIVEAHKGLLEVESREGQGSTFRVLLPVKYSIEQRA
jgi:putative PEP-CTERM system histidine kinase